MTVNIEKRNEKRGTKLLEKYFLEGKLADGETALAAELARHPHDDQTRFGLAMLQFLRAIEQLAQDLRRYGLRDLTGEGISLPFLRLPVPSNPQPEILTYETMRKIFEKLVDKFTQAEATLAPIKDEQVKLPVRFGMIRMDLDGDGIAGDHETLWKVYSSITREHSVTAEQAEKFSITFDRGDVHWLRGYCHLLSAVCQIYLAHDTRESFECNAHIFFPRVESPYPFLTRGRHVHNMMGTHFDIADLISVIHLLRWKVAEPWRMESALHHLEAMVKQNKDMWKFIMAETDDDNEWIPNPRQTGVIPNARVTDEMVEAWTGLMDKIEQILAGKLLIAFWRGDDARGINLRKVFLQPTTLDVVLWVQGPAAVPYLESGETTRIDTWQSLRDAFGSQLPGFALWFN